MTWFIGVDIGGTFTDCVCRSPEVTAYGKAPSTSDPEEGVIGALSAACSRVGVEVGDVLAGTERFVHGCTIGTNAVIERSGARVALLTSSGHEDVLRIGRLYQKVAGLSVSEISHTSLLHRPEPLVDHKLTFGITERVDRDGTVLVTLDEDQVRRVAGLLREAEVEAVAICYLWSFKAPAHEERSRALIEEELPGVDIVLSSRVAPALGEYERCVATVLNAYVNPGMKRYLEPLEEQLRGRGMNGYLQVFDAGGGVTSVRQALAMGVRTIDSGPVGGVVAARTLGKRLGLKNIICGDMGGTSFDVAVIWDTALEEDAQPTIDQYTFSIPRVAVKSVGAGGGSIAWLDSAGVLRVGPRSAGSNPGPACYGRGGTAPTVTDANLLLGILSRDGLLGGDMPMDYEAAERAYDTLATPIGKDRQIVAQAVVSLVNAQMADLVRRTTLERGFDPREFTMVVYGGAGPAHGVAIAEDVGCGAVLFPALSSVFAAQGMAECDVLSVAEQFIRLSAPFADEQLAAIRDVARKLQDDVAGRLADDGHDTSSAEYRVQIGMRYAGQVSELPVNGSWALNGLEANVAGDFADMYERTYGSGARVTGGLVEVMRVRLEARIAGDVLYEQKATNGGAGMQATRTRDVLFPDAEGSVETPVVKATDSLMDAIGGRVEGPLIIERYGETILVPPGRVCEATPNGDVLVRLTQR